MTTDSEGRGSLRDHLPSHQAPPQLRYRVRGSLAARGAARPPLMRWTALAAAAGLFFTFGIATGRATAEQTVATPAATPAPTPHATYALLLYGGHETDAEPKGARAQEYGRWASELKGARFVSGEELSDVVGEYTSKASRPTSSSEQVAGFFLIDAPDDATATAVAKDCPHLKYGGRVVLQKLPRA